MYWLCVTSYERNKGHRYERSKKLMRGAGITTNIRSYERNKGSQDTKPLPKSSMTQAWPLVRPERRKDTWMGLCALFIATKKICFKDSEYIYIEVNNLV